MSKKAPLLALILLCLLGCGGRPPQIERVFNQIILFHDRTVGQTVEKLSLFVRPHDPDGWEDLDSLHLIHDETELYWTLNSSSWQESEKEGERWLGSNGIVMADGSDLPRGTYRILLRDLSGESDEYEFDLPPGGTPPGGTAKARLRYPKSRIEESVILVESPHTINEIWIYDSDSRFRRSFPVDENGLTLARVTSQIENLSPDYHFFLYAYEEVMDVGLVTGPFFP